jgi:hypothetical protein
MLRMKRSRIITRPRDLGDEQGPNRPAEMDRREGEVARFSFESLVAVSASELKSMNVINAKGEKLGKIEDLMIDLKKGVYLMRFYPLEASWAWENYLPSPGNCYV